MAKSGRGWRHVRRNIAVITMASLFVVLAATAAYAASSGFNLPTNGMPGGGSHSTIGNNHRIDIRYISNPTITQIKPVTCDSTPVDISGYKTVAANNHSLQTLAIGVAFGTCFHLQVANNGLGGDRVTGTVFY